MNDTKQKILDTAAELFAEEGYAATSLRRIIAKAGVNLAAVHYHFGTKQALLDQIILEKVGPLNDRRLELLGNFEVEAAPNPPTVEKILEAFLSPAIMMAQRSGIIKIMARFHSEKSSMDAVLRNFQPLLLRYTAALHRALPDTSEAEIAWKVHFLIGSMTQTILLDPWLSSEATAEPADVIVKRIVAFTAAGFLAPVVLQNINGNQIK